MPTKPATAANPIEAIMTRDPVRVMGGTSASELAVLLDEHEISGVPVVDTQDRVIGVVSRTDLLHRCVEGPEGSVPGGFLASLAEGLGSLVETETLGTVSDFMHTEPVSALPSESIREVARRMIDERVHRAVIVDDEKHVLGIVTTLDMLRVVAG